METRTFVPEENRHEFLKRDKVVWPSATGKALREIITDQGVQVIRDSLVLSDLLSKKGINDLTCAQIQLALKSDSIIRYLENSEKKLTQIEMNNIVFALQDAGLTSNLARQLTADLLYGCNIPQDSAFKMHLYNQKKISEKEMKEEPIKLYIPPQYALTFLSDIKNKLRHGTTNYLEKLDGESISTLRYLAEGGLPEANFLLGRIYSEGLAGVEKNSEKGLQFVKKAMDLGWDEAYGYMGDYFFNNEKYEMAYYMYADQGSAGASVRQRNNLLWLYELLKYNKKLMLFWLGLILLSVIFSWVLFPVALKIIYSILALLECCGLVLLRRSIPFSAKQFRYTGTLMYVLFSVGILITVLMH